MKREAVNPTTMYNATQFGFSHAVASEGRRMLHLAGQVAWDKDNNLVGSGDLRAQAAQAFANLKEVLAAEGASAANVVRLRTYVVNYSPDQLEIIGPAIGVFYGDVIPAANTLIGVQCLAMPDFLIEIEATAVLS
ncbi:RidA family protein [Hoeflea sp. Naph1]|uniref:RidA family protein n=1 Tax=Hoeflea sp. Naph1 TaxID=3388653 RepID=UPI0039900386